MPGTCTYASASTFTMAGDQTTVLSKGDRLKLTQTTAKYFYVIGVSHSAGTTTVTVTGGTDYTLANAAITTPFYSKEASPAGQNVDTPPKVNAEAMGKRVIQGDVRPNGNKSTYRAPRSNGGGSPLEMGFTKPGKM